MKMCSDPDLHQAAKRLPICKMHVKNLPNPIWPPYGTFVTWTWSCMNIVYSSSLIHVASVFIFLVQDGRQAANFIFHILYIWKPFRSSFSYMMNEWITFILSSVMTYHMRSWCTSNKILVISNMAVIQLILDFLGCTFSQSDLSTLTQAVTFICARTPNDHVPEIEPQYWSRGCSGPH